MQFKLWRCLLMTFAVGWMLNTKNIQLRIQFAKQSGPEVIKLFFMLNSTEHEISTAHKN